MADVPFRQSVYGGWGGGPGPGGPSAIIPLERCAVKCKVRFKFTKSSFCGHGFALIMGYLKDVIRKGKHISNTSLSSLLQNEHSQSTPAARPGYFAAFGSFRERDRRAVAKYIFVCYRIT